MDLHAGPGREGAQGPGLGVRKPNARKERATTDDSGEWMADTHAYHPHESTLSYARLDGATPQAKRESALADFAGKRSVRVMIISLKAGWVRFWSGYCGIGVGFGVRGIVLLTAHLKK